jgi:hypothetical protein
MTTPITRCRFHTADCDTCRRLRNRVAELETTVERLTRIIAGTNKATRAARLARDARRIAEAHVQGGLDAGLLTVSEVTEMLSRLSGTPPRRTLH